MTIVAARDINFGAELRKRRLAKGDSLRSFAKQLEIKPTYLSLVETGKVPASEKIVIRAAKILGEDLSLYAERFTEKMRKIAGKHPKAVADLFSVLEKQPENAILRLVREVRDGKW